MNSSGTHPEIWVAKHPTLDTYSVLFHTDRSKIKADIPGFQYAFGVQVSPTSLFLIWRAHLKNNNNNNCASSKISWLSGNEAMNDCFRDNFLPIRAHGCWDYNRFWEIDFIRSLPSTMVDLDPLLWHGTPILSGASERVKVNFGERNLSPFHFRLVSCHVNFFQHFFNVYLFVCWFKNVTMEILRRVNFELKTLLKLVHSFLPNVTHSQINSLRHFQIACVFNHEFVSVRLIDFVSIFFRIFKLIGIFCNNPVTWLFRIFSGFLVSKCELIQDVNYISIWSYF